jgi:predicted SAM-dependent methyltransferase
MTSLRRSLNRFLARTRLLESAMEIAPLRPILRISNQKILQRHQTGEPLRLHLGCGSKTLKGWVNIDSIWRPNVAVMTLPDDLRRFRKSSVEYIYASHLLEHLSYPKQVTALLTTCYQILEGGGVLRLAVPDIEAIINAYSRNDEAFFEVQSQLHPPWCTTKLEHLMYALQQDGEHRFGYDFETLQKVLLQSGFENIVRSSFGQSTFEALRVDYRDDHGLTLFVDAVKKPS